MRFYFIIAFIFRCLPILTLTLSNIEASCTNGQVYHDEFRKCCERRICLAGKYFACEECIDCPQGTFLDVPSNRTSCKKHSQCNEVQKEIFPGNSIRDKQCACKDGFMPDETDAWKCVELTTTSSGLTGSLTTPYNATPTNFNGTWNKLPLKPGYIFGIIIIIIIIIVIICLVAVIVCYCKSWLCFKKYQDKNKKGQNDKGSVSENGHAPLMAGPSNLLAEQAGFDGKIYPRAALLRGKKNEYESAERNISINWSKLQKDMDVSDTKFWAALKEGDSYSQEEHERCSKKPISMERIHEISDLACKNNKKMDSLIYALVVTGQSDIAEIISASLAVKFEPKDSKMPRIFKSGDTYQKRIINNLVYLLDNICLDDEFWGYLRTGDVYTEMDQQICDTRTQNFSIDYIISLALKNKNKYNNFIMALNGTKQSHLTDLITGRKSTDNGGSTEDQNLLLNEERNSISIQFSETECDTLKV